MTVRSGMDAIVRWFNWIHVTPLKRRGSLPSAQGSQRRHRFSTVVAREGRLLVATCSTLVHAGLRWLLHEGVPQLRYVAGASTREQLVEMLQNHRPDALVLDHEMALGMESLVSMPERPRILLISRRQHPGTDMPWIEQCACGFVRESSPARHIRTALRIIGGCTAQTLGKGYCASCPLRNSMQLPDLPLSAREYAVFERIGLGEGSKRIAREFNLSVKTIEAHRESIKRKLGLGSALELSAAAGAWRRGEYEFQPDATAAKSGPRK